MIRHRILGDLLGADLEWDWMAWPLTFHLASYIVAHANEQTIHLPFSNDVFSSHPLPPSLHYQATRIVKGLNSEPNWQKASLSLKTCSQTHSALQYFEPKLKKMNNFWHPHQKGCTIIPSSLESIPSQGKASIQVPDAWKGQSYMELWINTDTHIRDIIYI